MAENKRAAYRDETYWGKPVPNFGEPDARLLIVGLAPGAHGANRTGRMFTGDRSGDFLYKVMHATGFASQPTSVALDDGLTLIDAVITGAAHCAPPGNKPRTEELQTCSSFMDETFELMNRLQVVIALGKLAADAVLRRWKRLGLISSLGAYPFGHGVIYEVEGATPLLCSYHPSQQNTFTGRLTEDMLADVFRQARRVMNGAKG